jgi:iron complex transport system substrate-binding protein
MADRAPMSRWVCVALGCLLVGWTQAQTVVIDDRGHALTFAAPPQRIVSLLPAITEMVCELGACERLVGVDRHSNHPPQVRDLPRLGGMEDTPLEALVQLQPDLVLLAGSSRMLKRMQSLGLRVMVFEPRDGADTARMGQALARLLGVGDAAWAGYEARQQQAWRDLAGRIGAELAQGRVYIEVGEGPYVAAQSSFIGQALQRVGLQAAIPGTWGVFPRVSPEWVLREQPDWIVLSSTAAPPARRPGWSRLLAVQKGRVCTLNPGQMDTLVRPGPRLSEGIAAILACMTPPTRQP